MNTTAHNPQMTTLISSQPKMLPSLSSMLSSTNPGVAKAALGLVHVLALEVSKAQNSFANPVNVDLVRMQLVTYTPVLEAVLSTLLAPGKLHTWQVMLRPCTHSCADGQKNLLCLFIVNSLRMLTW